MKPLFRSTQMMSKPRLSDDDDSQLDEENVSDLLANAVKVYTLYDTQKNLVEIKFLKNKAIPRKVIQVIGLAIPYHKHLTAITINSGLHIETLYEIAKLLPDSNIKELCLDGTFLSKANYHILLTHGKLKYLSLARCSINDIVVKTITDQLRGASPASTVLSALNLSSNSITDVGAKYVAAMLRTNRHLTYLNIASNMMTDEGGMSILDTLQKFPLDSQECLESRGRHVAYLKKKNEFIHEIIKQLQAAKNRSPRKKTLAKNREKSEASLQHHQNKSDLVVVDETRLIQEKAHVMAETKMGLFNDPFSPNNTESQGDVVRCLGNNTLCYLNLAYNNLTYFSVRKLHEVLLTQKSLNRTPRGLIKVVIEGNLMPSACKEYEEINRLLGNISSTSNINYRNKSSLRRLKLRP